MGSVTIKYPKLAALKLDATSPRIKCWQYEAVESMPPPPSPTKAHTIKTTLSFEQNLDFALKGSFKGIYG